MKPETIVGAIMDLEPTLGDFNTARKSLAYFLEDHALSTDRYEMLYCILNTLDKAESQGQAVFKVLWESIETVRAGSPDVPKEAA